MKLAQALQIRSELQNRIQELRMSLNRNALKQENEEPAEDPKLLLSEIEKASLELQNLHYKINMTNNQVQSPEGNLTYLLAKRDRLQTERSTYVGFITEASSTAPRHGINEIKHFPSLPLKEMRKLADAKAKKLREIDLLIQELNWTSELIELD